METGPAVRALFDEGQIVNDATGDSTAKRLKTEWEKNGPHFGSLLARLDLDRQLAWEAYEKLRKKLVTYFQRRGHPLDAEELAEETLDRIARNPEVGKIETVNAFALAVARNVRREAFRKTPPKVSIEQSEDFPGRDENPEHTILTAIDSKHRLECFLQCMRRLAPKERSLILSYYPAENDDLEARRQRLAESLRIDSAALRARLARGRQKLEQCCSECYRRPAKHSA
jgi:RNA polymerase sigma factor (sigma-70 family)